MWYRLILACSTVFFVTMNVLLWRSEISGRDKMGGAVPVEVVWEKILTAPDNSTLEIRRRGTKIGYCRWSPNVGEELATGKVMSEDLPPEGMIRHVLGYTLDFDGSVSFDTATHVRFDLHLELSTNYVWETFNLRLAFRPLVLILNSVAAEEQLRLRVEDGEKARNEVFTFEELRQPDKVLRRMAAPWMADALKGALPSGNLTNQVAGLEVRWTARHDWMTIGRSRIRAYRLETNLLGSRVAVLVSHVGEILRVELPDEIVLANDALSSL